MPAASHGLQTCLCAAAPTDCAKEFVVHSNRRLAIPFTVQKTGYKNPSDPSNRLDPFFYRTCATNAHFCAVSWTHHSPAPKQVNSFNWKHNLNCDCWAHDQWRCRTPSCGLFSSVYAEQWPQSPLHQAAHTFNMQTYIHIHVVKTRSCSGSYHGALGR